MKLCILFTGRLTNYDKNFDNFILNIVQDHEVDIYMIYSKEKCNRDLVAGFKKLYSPVECKESDENIFHIDYDNIMISRYYEKYGGFENLPKKWLSRKYLIDMIKDKPKYDLYLHTRLDVSYPNPLDYDMINYNYLNIPDTKKDFCGFQDIMALGTYDKIIIYLSVYDKLLDIWRTRKTNPERNLEVALRNETVHRFLFDIKMDVFCRLKKTFLKKNKIQSCDPDHVVNADHIVKNL